MCQAIPRPVLRVSGDRAEVVYDGVPTWVTVQGIPNLAAGEYVVGAAVEDRCGRDTAVLDRSGADAR